MAIVPCRSDSGIVQDEIDSGRKQIFSDLLDEIKVLDTDRITWEKFVAVSDRIIQEFSEAPEDYTNDLRSVSNLLF